MKSQHRSIYSIDKVTCLYILSMIKVSLFLLEFACKCWNEKL